MPFSKENAALYGSKGGKQGRAKQPPENIRNKQINIKLSQERFDSITEKAKASGLSRNEFIVRAAEAYLEEKNENNGE